MRGNTNVVPYCRCSDLIIRPTKIKLFIPIQLGFCEYFEVNYDIPIYDQPSNVKYILYHFEWAGLMRKPFVSFPYINCEALAHFDARRLEITFYRSEGAKGASYIDYLVDEILLVMDATLLTRM